jgi:sugar O-acyltransferase (sialic acid O-acetyltransferase NeuD family)
MKNIIIIGARGMGRTIHNYLEEFNEYKIDFKIKGFLDNKKDALKDFENYAPILSSVEEYQICKNDFFICSLGDVREKIRYTNIISDKGGFFFTLIHPLARVMKDAIIGKGSIIGPWCAIGTGSIIGDNCLIQTSTIIGHDVKIGNWSRVDTNVVCAGNAIIGSKVTVHTSAIINQKAIIGDNAVIGAGCFVLKSVKEGTTVIGNPAKVLRI